MDHNNIYETLGNLKVKVTLRPEPRNQVNTKINKLHAKYIWQDEKTGQIKERLLSSAAASASIENSAKLIHSFMFGR